jgi:hypothetical protein
MRPNNHVGELTTVSNDRANHCTNKRGIHRHRSCKANKMHAAETEDNDSEGGGKGRRLDERPYGLP